MRNDQHERAAREIKVVLRAKCRSLCPGRNPSSGIEIKGLVDTICMPPTQPSARHAAMLHHAIVSRTTRLADEKK